MINSQVVARFLNCLDRVASEYGFDPTEWNNPAHKIARDHHPELKKFKRRFAVKPGRPKSWHFLKSLMLVWDVEKLLREGRPSVSDACRELCLKETWNNLSPDTLRVHYQVFKQQGYVQLVQDIVDAIDLRATKFAFETLDNPEGRKKILEDLEAKL